MILRDEPEPRPGPGEVLLRVHHCGICGSDLHWYGGGSHPPRVCPGHEISGEIVDLGPAVEGWETGERVVLEAVRSCGSCRFCESGHTQRCPAHQITGLHIPGGFAELVCVAARQLHRVPDGLDQDVAQLAEPLAVGVHAMRLVDYRPGERVLVLGAGSIGLMAVAAARAAGAEDIAITAKRPHQQTAARALGATLCATPGGDEQLDQWCQEHPPEVVVETVGGVSTTMHDAVRYVAPGGRVAVAGVFHEAHPVDLLDVMRKEAALIGANTYGRGFGRPDFALALEQLSSADEDFRRIFLTHAYPLEDIAEAFRQAASKEGGAIKVSVGPA